MRLATRLAVLMLSISAFAQSTAEFTISGEAIESPVPAGYYYLSVSPEYELRVILYEYWGQYILYIDKLWVDDIEGLPHVSYSIRVTAEELAERIGMDYVASLEFLEWTGPTSFRMGFNGGQSVTVERTGKGTYLFTRE